MFRSSRLLMVCVLIGGGGYAALAADEFVFHHENVLGTSMELRGIAENEAAATLAESRALAEIDRLAKILSSYDKSSELSLWAKTKGLPIKLSPELIEILSSSDVWMEKSGGAFDPRVQALTALWSQTAKLDRVPTSEELAKVKALMAGPAWQLDLSAGLAEHLGDAPLSFNSIGKGFIIGRATSAAFNKNAGIHGVLLNIGGDIRVVGDKPHRIGVTPPRGDSENTQALTIVEIQNRSIATSGDYQRGFKIKGKSFSHIFDPRSGQPAGETISATVIAEKASTANALATTFCVLSPEESLKLAKASGVECLLVKADGRVVRSPGFSGFERTRAKLVVQKDTSKADEGWGAKSELSVKFEVAPTGGDARRYRRPYLAVWLEDADGVPVRTLALWLQSRQPGPRWFPDLKRWYKSDQVRKLVDDADLITTTSRATRAPGKYEVIWDGKDDHGKPLKAGEYTLFIEVAREHGTYQVIRKPVNVGGEAFSEELKGNVEIKSAAVEFRRKTRSK